VAAEIFSPVARNSAAARSAQGDAATAANVSYADPELNPGVSPSCLATLFEIDPQTLQILHRLDFAAGEAGAVAVGAGAVWTTGGIAGGDTPLSNSVTKIDSRTDRIIGTFPLGNRTRATCGIAATATAVWVTVGNGSCDTIGR
jgi:DNA-binding beta-propeller fold protein YncE